ncbi:MULTISPECIES: peptidylprolyl isomerase [Ensifer]|jgi:peptidyl-prolyl cis-trans isomerase C|uniref:Parvulin-like PPIase n=1 Tax=Ensifer canadensis TaxID=555315 RepID=A0AAW4FVG3_9HYPH|nr:MULTISPECIES: peptidylprolyl isomerase [Ensifer]AHK42198.1 putative foldase/peptidyl-prolyl cis-trans isomerase [Ensifer adhaerens OV14]MDP9634784.1 peptidyl-prolyl cis-trans isomerase C [Ensifer adhaerens]KQU81748.1 peptidylprolyl isomerase [Ensifer sp. Root31]KQW48289.1 peptidylprolyl isomerase [Ensifer sp. Root1252]KQY66279.1 peptidylprolyl isomerase [Ensifer sp. Root142]
MSKFKTLAAAALVAAIAVHGVARAEDADPVIATVGGEEVRQSELNLALGGLDPQLQQMPEEQKRAAALSAVIDVKLLSKTAEKEGLQDDAAFKQRLAYLTERELHNAFFKKHVVDAITKEEVKARYDKEIAAVPVQEEIKARHILVKTEEEAKEIIKELDAGKSFVELAKAKSSDPNKDDGGDLGYFTKGRMVPEFDAVVFTLDKGAYTKTPVKTQFGFHVILVEDKRPQAPPALEQVEPQVRQLVMRDKYVELLTAAKKDAGVEISDPALKKAYDEANKAQEAK